MRFLIRTLLAISFFFTGNLLVQAKTDNFGTWFELEFRKDFLKQFSFSLVPEFRFQDQFKLDEYMIQGKLAYSPFSFLSIAGTYRLGTEIKNKGNFHYNRIALDLQASHEFDRFEASLRTRYTNSSELDGDDEGQFFRPRIKIEYNIKGNKITPFASYELFHDLIDKELQKSRIDLGFTRKVGKLHRVGLYYRLQDYFTGRNSKHIVGIDYRLRF